MVELTAKHPPIDVKSASDSSLEIDFDETSVNEGGANEAAARMQVICQFARESLLSYVKKDVNLTVYPGSIALPADLYAPRLRTSQSPMNDDTSEESIEPPKKRSSGTKAKSKKAAPKQVHSQDDDSVFGEEDKLPSPETSPVEATAPPPVAKDDDSSVFGGDSPAFSPPASPMASDTHDFDKGLDVSPIAQAESPQKPAAKPVVDKKRSSVASQKVVKKRKTIEVNPFDEFPSPLSNEEPSFLSSQGSSKKPAGRRSKKGKSTPVVAATTASSSGKKRSTSSGKSKPTPVSIESKAMVNITNKSEAVRKSKVVEKKKTQRKVASQSTDDEFDFPHSPPKAASKRASKKSPSLLSDKAAPARKSRAPTKPKVGKAKKASESSPSTTSPTESSPASVRRGTRRTARARA